MRSFQYWCADLCAGGPGSGLVCLCAYPQVGSAAVNCVGWAPVPEAGSSEASPAPAAAPPPHDSCLTPTHTNTGINMFVQIFTSIRTLSLRQIERIIWNKGTEVQTACQISLSIQYFFYLFQCALINTDNTIYDYITFQICITITMDCHCIKLICCSTCTSILIERRSSDQRHITCSFSER